MGTNVENGSSVYCQGDIEIKEQQPLYQAVRRTVQRNPSGIILDLGCSDMPASHLLAQNGYQVIGLDLGISCLEKAKKRNPQANLVQADLIENLPFCPRVDVNSVLLLDVLEHLGKKEAIRLLKTIIDYYPQAQLIISMPIISPYSLPCLYELFQVIRQRKRPATGLFDRTHKILVGRSGHQEIFAKGGYEICETYTTNMFEGVTDYPEYLENKHNYPENRKKRLLRILYDHLPKDTNNQLFSYQALYVLKPV